MSGPNHWAMIINPAAGGGRCGDLAREALSMLSDRGLKVSPMVSQQDGDTCELIERAARLGVGRVVLCGGDGTVHHALPALVSTQLPAALLPLGTANDLSRALGIPRRLPAAVQALCSSQARSLDLGRVNGVLFATVASVGLDAEINHHLATRPGRSAGTWVYLLTAVRLALGYRPRVARIRTPNGELRQATLLVAMANTQSYGGGLRIAPRADPGDGLLDICRVDAMPLPRMLALMPRLFWGGHTTHPAVHLDRVPWIEIDTGEPAPVYADGECAGRTPVRVEVAVGAIRVVAPSQPG
jgi:diacylglycerol kinase (ATP)